MIERDPQLTDMTIVLVDDEPLAVDLTQGYLRSQLGVRTEVFGDPLLALDTLRRGSTVDMVITDHRMPGISGIELIAALREDSRFDEVPVIMLTAAHERVIRHTALRLGANDFLDKGVDPLELAVRVRNMLKLRQRTLALAEANRRLQALAVTDSLTGIANRRRVFDQLGEHCRLSRRTGRPLSVILLDVDRFKQVNDTHGHPVGDKVLQMVARIGTETLRTTDLIGRIGGEEFAVLLPDTNLHQAELTAERLRTAIAKGAVETAGGRLLSVTASFGVALIGPWDADGTEAMSRADAALYRAKADGRDRVTVAETVQQG